MTDANMLPVTTLLMDTHPAPNPDVNKMLIQNSDTKVKVGGNRNIAFIGARLNRARTRITNRKMHSAIAKPPKIISEFMSSPLRQ
jgi:hypothetical protein